MNGSIPAGAGHAGVPGILAVVVALTRSLRSLRAPRVWFYVLAPALLALIIWLLLATYWMGSAITWMISWPPLSWLVSWDFPGLARFLAGIAAWLIILMASTLTATLLAAIVVLPFLLGWLAETEYRDVAKMGDDSIAASVANSVAAVAIYMGLWLLSLPLWLIPGVGLVLPVFLLAGLNRRTFAFDALAMHATRDEWREIRTRHAHALFILSLLLALLAHIPLLGLLVPTLAVLSFVHYGLEALRQARQGAVISGTAVRVDED